MPKGRHATLRASENQRRFPWWIVPLILLTALVAYAFLLKPVEVATASVAEGILALDLSSTGIVESNLSDIAPRATAPVARLYVQGGQEVRKGQPLAELQDLNLCADR